MSDLFDLFITLNPCLLGEVLELFTYSVDNYFVGFEEKRVPQPALPIHDELNSEGRYLSYFMLVFVLILVAENSLSINLATLSLEGGNSTPVCIFNYKNVQNYLTLMDRSDSQQFIIHYGVNF